MISDEFDAAWQATWPAADYAQAGGLRVGRGLGGGGRVSAARVTGPWDASDIPKAEAQHAAWDQPALFAIEDGDPIAPALADRGYVRTRPTLILSAPVASLAEPPIPPVMALECWPPLAILRELWTEQGIGPDRQAVMGRVAGPRVAILGRIDDRAAAAGFAAVHGNIATLHALAVLPGFRRRGLAGWMVRRAARFAAAQGAGTLALAVTEANREARALYDALGFHRIGSYAYWTR